MIPGPADDHVAGAGSGCVSAGALPMFRRDTGSSATFENRVNSDDPVAIEDADHVWQLLHLDDAAGPIGNAVVIATNGNQAIVADTALELEHGIEWRWGQRLQFGLLGSKGFGNNLLRRAVHPDIGDGHQPIVKLAIEIVEMRGRCGQGRSPAGYS